MAILAVAGAGYLLWRAGSSSSGSNIDLPGGTLWLCRRPECARDFALSTKDLGAFYDTNPGGSPPCPACGKAETIRAIRCPGCSKAIVPPARNSPGAKKQAHSCPHCGRALK